MQKVVVKTATEARNEFFDLLAAAKYGGQITIVTKNGQEAGQIGPRETKKKFDWKAYDKAVKGFVGLITDEDVEDMKRARKGFKSRFPTW